MAEELDRRAIELHRKNRGKLEVKSKVDASTREGLSLAYTPGVAAVCNEIVKNPDAVYDLTMKWNSVAVVSDCTRVLGLGNIGPLAGMPVMEGKAVLFKSYANIDAFPICLSCHSADEIVATVKNISPVFGGINLEDIESPKCFSVEERLKKELPIPVFHDDQHGTAVVVLAGLINALKVVGKNKKSARIVVAGAGAAGCAIAKLLVADGFSDVLVCDSKGILSDSEGLAPYKRELARLTNRRGKTGTLADAMQGADALIGLSAPNIISSEMVKSMGASPIIFALSNPVPEIAPELAKKSGVKIFGTARADLPNQVNNVLGFPGIFRGALIVRARQIDERMKLAAAYALAFVVGEKELSRDFVLPFAYDRRVVPAVATAVAKAAMKSNVAGLKKSDAEIRNELGALGLL
ncbi:TPA: NADP-dependent malic enzyme [Candidatus Micrarchaeota archaeon]|nr:NADP-dependent malic enzyme [Candidatus Micrarchaeota archaeon]HIH30855.1 NADP-dependent malic enzyme [Candidatus Micrarchaeota archaeon]